MESYLEILPEEIVSKITLYNRHPVADLFKECETYQSFYKCFPNGEMRYHDDDKEFIHEACFIQHWAMLQDEKREIHDDDSDDDSDERCEKYCYSCDYYYSNVCICCPRCD